MRLGLRWVLLDRLDGAINTDQVAHRQGDDSGLLGVVPALKFFLDDFKSQG